MFRQYDQPRGAIPASQKFRVYLAGPISGSNYVQMGRWCAAVNKAYGSRMTILDPVDNRLSPDPSPYEFVDTDLQNIMEAVPIEAIEPR